MEATTIFNHDESPTTSMRLRVALRINNPDDKAKEAIDLNAIDKGSEQYPVTVTRTENNADYKIEFPQRKESWFSETETKLPIRSYNFPYIFASKENNELYHELILPLKQQIIDGYIVTVIGFGATGTGKTHTLIDHPIQMASLPEVPSDNLAILPRLFIDLSSTLKQLKDRSACSSFHMNNFDGTQSLRS